jgi:hypothetical protein
VKLACAVVDVVGIVGKHAVFPIPAKHALALHSMRNDISAQLPITSVKNPPSQIRIRTANLGDHGVSNGNIRIP